MNENVCELCLRGPQETLVGELVKRNSSMDHTACLLLSSGVYLNPNESNDVSKDHMFQELAASCLCSDPRQVKNLNCDYFSSVSHLDTLLAPSNYFDKKCSLCNSKRGTLFSNPVNNIIYQSSSTPKTANQCMQDRILYSIYLHLSSSSL